MSEGGISLDIEYLKSVSGIVKIVELVFGLIVSGVTTIDVFFLNHNGGGWIMFVAVTALMITLVLLVLNLISLWSRLPTWRLLLEFVYCIICMIGYFISGVIAAANAPKRDPAIAATAFFAFMNFLAYAVDAFFAFWVWRAGVNQESATTTTTTTTTTSSSATVTNVQAGQTQY